MKVLVIGAGAIGGLIGGRLALAGHQVTLVDKPDVVTALKARGLTVIDRDGVAARPNAVTALMEATEGPDPDLAILAVKAHDIGDVAQLAGRCASRGVPLITVQNGIPWWYFQRHGGDLEGTQLTSLDPDGRIARSIDAEHIVGCVAYPAAEVVEPGVVRHIEGSGLPIGELDGQERQRTGAISQALQSAGFKAPIVNNIRPELWLKAWGALSFNPISALTGATMRAICADSSARRIVADMMREAQQVAERLGIVFRVSLERRIEGAARVGDHKTSMLQDREAGRRLEIEALVGSVIEIAALVGIRTPIIDTVYALTKLLDEQIGERQAA
jgi:2-dehydropantoate 2-reductase